MTDTEIKKEYPPNWEAIRQQFSFEGIQLEGKDLVFTYFPHVYVPSGRELPPDLQIHEGIHLRQQEEMGVENWWHKYLSDIDFRLSQELEAYGAQLHFWRPFGNRAYKHHKARLAHDLSSDAYGNIINHREAESKIRNVEKTID